MTRLTSIFTNHITYYKSQCFQPGSRADLEFASGHSELLEPAFRVPCASASSSHPHLPRRSCTCVKHSAEELEHSKSVMNLAIITLSHQILQLTRCFIVDTQNKGSSRSLLNVCIKFPHLFSCLLIKSNFLAPYDKPLIWLILHLVSVGNSISLRFLPQLVANSESASYV